VAAGGVNPLPVILRWTLVVATTLVIQVAVMPSFTVFGVVPNLMVMLAACAGLSGGAQRGAVVGFWIGLAFDAPRPVPLGVSALAFTFVAFGAGTFQVAVLQAGRAISMVLVGLSSAVGVLVYALVGEVFNQDSLAHPRLGAIVVVEAIVAAALSRVGLKVAGWADGPEVRAVAE